VLAIRAISDYELPDSGGVLGRLSIRTHLDFGTLFYLSLLVVIGGMGYLALDRTRATLDSLFSQRVQTLANVAPPAWLPPRMDPTMCSPIKTTEQPPVPTHPGRHRTPTHASNGLSRTLQGGG
jgi:hypothetical protein